VQWIFDKLATPGFASVILLAVMDATVLDDSPPKVRTFERVSRTHALKNYYTYKTTDLFFIK